MTDAQKRAIEKYREKRGGVTAIQKSISATFRRDEAERIAEIFKTHGLKPSEVLRGAAAALLDGEPIRTEAAPLIAPKEAGGTETVPAPVEDDSTTDGEE